jgi:hypothetical protein
MTNRQAPKWRKRGTGLPPKYGPAHTADPTASTLMGSRAYCGTWFPHGRDKLWTNAGPDDRKCRECERGAQRTVTKAELRQLLTGKPDTPDPNIY